MCQDDYGVNQVHSSSYWIVKIWSMDWFDFKNTVTWDTWAQISIFVAGFIFVWWQLKAQRESQKKQHIDTIKYNAYKEFADSFEECSPAGVAKSLDILIKEFYRELAHVESGELYRAPAMRYDTFHIDFKELHRKMRVLVAAIERYEIISPYMPTFRKVISYKSTELFEMNMQLIFRLAYYLPHTDGKSALFIPSKGIINELEVIVRKYQEIAMDIDYYLDDLNTELQNTLLGDFFDQKLPVRKPEDPDVLVLTSTDQKMIAKAKEIAKQDDILRNSGGMVLDGIWDNARENARESATRATVQ